MSVLLLRQLRLHPIAFASFWIPLLGHGLFFGFVNRFGELRAEIANGAVLLSKVPLFSFEVEIPKQLGIAIFAYLPCGDILAALCGSLLLAIILEIFSFFPPATLRQAQFVYLPAFLLAWNFYFGYLNLFSFAMGMAAEPSPVSAVEVSARFGILLQDFPGLAAGSLVLGAWSAAVFSVFFLLFQLLCLRRRRKKLVLL